MDNLTAEGEAIDSASIFKEFAKLNQLIRALIFLKFPSNQKLSSLNLVVASILQDEIWKVQPYLHVIEFDLQLRKLEFFALIQENVVLGVLGALIDNHLLYLFDQRVVSRQLPETLITGGELSIAYI